jgi:hypothetical protein
MEQSEPTLLLAVHAVVGCEAGHPFCEMAGGSASVIGRLVAK